MNWLLLHATNICWNFVWSQFIGTHGHTDIISLKVFRIQRTYVRNKLRLSESFITNNKHTRAHAHSRSYNTAEATYGLCVFNIRLFDFPSLFRCPLLRSLGIGVIMLFIHSSCVRFVCISFRLHLSQCLVVRGLHVECHQNEEASRGKKTHTIFVYIYEYPIKGNIQTSNINLIFREAGYLFLATFGSFTCFPFCFGASFYLSPPSDHCW